MDITIGNDGGSFYDNFINMSEIANVTSLKNLGIVLDSKLRFASHVTQIISTAKKRMALLFRTVVTKDSCALIQGFKSYILPLLNYNSSAWFPSSVGDIGLIESVQRNFTKRISTVNSLSYMNRLDVLKLPTLKLRRLYADLIFCCKILKGTVTVPPKNCGLFLVERHSRSNWKSY